MIDLGKADKEEQKVIGCLGKMSSRALKWKTKPEIKKKTIDELSNFAQGILICDRQLNFPS